MCRLARFEALLQTVLRPSFTVIYRDYLLVAQSDTLLKDFPSERGSGAFLPIGFFRITP